MNYYNNPFSCFGAMAKWLLIFVFGFSYVSYAQPSILTNLTSFEKSGDKKFYLFSYKAAAQDYEQALNQDPKKEHLKIKIAECYRLLNEPLLVEKWYSQVITNNQLIKPEHKMHYAQALSSNGKYQEAKKWLEEYQRDINNDSRVGKKLTAINNLNQLLKDSLRYVVVPLNINSTESDFSPAYYKDGIVFVSGRKQTKAMKTIFAWNESQFLDLYFSQESETGNNLAPRLFHQNVNTSLHEGPTVFYDDYSKMIFTRNNLLNRKQGESKDGIVKLKLYSTSGNKDSETWSKPESLPFNSDEYSIGHPSITNDGNTLYFASDMPGGFGGTDIYKSVKEGNTWSKPENLGAEINTEGNEVFPFIFNRTILYYSSNGMGGLGGLDIFRADLSNKTARNLGSPINSSVDDFGLITKDDSETGYLSSNRKPTTGSDDIYHFTVMKKVIEVIAYDYETGGLIPGAECRILDAEVTRQKSITGIEGSSHFGIDPRKNYVARLTSEGYLPSEGKLESTLLLQKDFTQIRMPLIKSQQNGGLEIVGDSIKAIVEFNSTGKGIPVNIANTSFGISEENPNVKSIKIYQIINGANVQEVALANNKAYILDVDNKSLKNNLDETLLELPNTMPAELNNRQQLLIKEFGKGNIAVKFVIIHNIYYDYNKSNIRNDASALLDHLVNLLLDYPELYVTLSSHTDSRGSTVYNQALSKKRAEAAKEYLVNEGIETERIGYSWFGEQHLTNKCPDNQSCDESNHQLNRRTEIALKLKSGTN